MCSMNEHTLKEDILNILRALSSSNEFTQRDLAFLLDFSLGKTNYLLKFLAREGLVEIKNFSQRDKKKAQYILTRKGLEEKLKLTYHFLKRKEDEYQRIKKEWSVLETQGIDQRK